MAIALTWNGRVDLDLNFDEFFNSDFTICVWFMSQFPDSYINPIVAAGDPTGTQIFDPKKLAFFVMGTGEYNKSTKLFLRAGDEKKEKEYGATFHPNRWHHLALVRKGNIFRLYIDSVSLVSAINSDIKAPKNVPLRLGQTKAWRHLSQKRPAQFYGLIDDVAVYTKALTDAEITDLKKKKTVPTGNEPSLLAAWLFSKKTETSPKLKRKFTLHGGASKVFESQPRDSEKDAELLPLPEPKFHFELPCPKEQLIYVGQSPFDLGGSHEGARNFPFDFSFITMINPTGKPGDKRVRIDEVPFHAVSDGKVVFIDGDHGAGKEAKDTNSMFVSVKGMPGFYWKHLHWKKGSENVVVGENVTVGKVLALASNSGVSGKDNFHLHTALVFFPDGQEPPDKDGTTTVTVPVAFTNYERLNRITHANGEVEDEWETVEVGIPRNGEILLVPGKGLMDFFDEPLTKQELFRFRDFASRKRIGTHEARRQM